MRIIFAAALCVALGGCASITQGAVETITIISTPPGVDAQITGLDSPIDTRCTTPCSFVAQRTDNVSVIFRKEGYETQDAHLKITSSVSGSLAVGGNVIAGGLPGIAVDTYSGGAYHHEPNPVMVTMQPNGPPRNGGHT
jgi:hypothetical protein